MPKREIGDKMYSHRREVTSDDLIVVDEYEDGTYRLFIPGDYQTDEIDEDFATVDSIREYLGLRECSKVDEFITERDKLNEQIKQAKIRLETVKLQIDGAKDITDVLPDITPRGEELLEGLLLLIEKSDSRFHELWSDVRSVAIDENGVQTFGPCQMIPPRDKDEKETSDSA